MKQGVEAALARLRPEYGDYAVVFDSDRWVPHQPPAGSEWDYDPYLTLEQAREAMQGLGPGLAEPELWQRRESRWEPVPVSASGSDSPGQPA